MGGCLHEGKEAVRATRDEATAAADARAGEQRDAAVAEARDALAAKNAEVSRADLEMACCVRISPVHHLEYCQIHWPPRLRAEVAAKDAELDELISSRAVLESITHDNMLISRLRHSSPTRWCGA